MNHSYPTIQRGGILLSPDPKDERETEGILNPAVAGPYLLYRAVGPRNYSRIMVAKLEYSRIGEDEVTIKASKLNQVAIEPEENYEISAPGHGGTEDPRITQMPNGQYIMTYTGFGQPDGFSKQTTVVALATSKDGLTWHKEGRLSYTPYNNGEMTVDFNYIPNKDTVIFGEKINGRYAMLHRPMFTQEQAHQYHLPWRAIWYAESDTLQGPWDNHQLILQPHFSWEEGGIGAGVPPIRLHDAWIHVYHGFTNYDARVEYRAGVFITPHDEPTKILYRSQCAMLEPEHIVEREGTVPDVVFPTAVWRFPDDQDSLAIFWGGGDSHILWGQLHLPSPLVSTKHI